MFSLALTLTLLQAAPLSRAERAIAAHVQANGQSAVALLERVVNINSGTLNLPGVRRVGEVFKAEFDRLGFSTRWVDGAHSAGPVT